MNHSFLCKIYVGHPEKKYKCIFFSLLSYVRNMSKFDDDSTNISFLPFSFVFFQKGVGLGEKLV